jgi:hypothetical protein
MNPNPYPKSFKFICTAAIVLGVLGLISAIMGGTTVIFGSEKVSQAAALQQATPELQAFQDGLLEETNAITERWKIPNGLVAIYKLFIGAALIFAGVLAQRVTEKGRALLGRVMLAAMILDPIAAIPGAGVRIATSRATKQFIEEMVKNSGGGDEAALQMVMGTAMSASMYGGLFVIALWLIAKLVYFGWGRSRLAAPDVEAFFREHAR